MAQLQSQCLVYSTGKACRLCPWQGGCCLLLFSFPFNLTTNNFRSKPSLPCSRTQNKLSTDLYIYKQWKARIKMWDLLVKPNDQVMRMPGQATKTTLVSVWALWVQNAHCDRGMITVQSWRGWHRYKKTQPQLPEFVLSTAEAICNILFGQNFRTWHIICMCPFLPL